MQLSLQTPKHLRVKINDESVYNKEKFACGGVACHLVWKIENESA